MHVISKRRLVEFSRVHADALDALPGWYDVAKRAHWTTLADVRADFPHADLVGNKVVFNVRGNRYRLITAIHFNVGKVFIREVLTHADYNRGNWKSR